MTELYGSGENLVPDLLCYEMLPADNEEELSLSFGSALKFDPLLAGPVPAHAPGPHCREDAGGRCHAEVPAPLHPGVEFARPIAGAPAPGAFDDSRTVPSLPVQPSLSLPGLAALSRAAARPCRAALRPVPGADSPAVIANDCSAAGSFLKMRVERAAAADSTASQEVPRLGRAYRQMLRKHRATVADEPAAVPSSGRGGGTGWPAPIPGWTGEMHYMNSLDCCDCDCDEHLVPRWYVEE